MYIHVLLFYYHYYKFYHTRFLFYKKLRLIFSSFLGSLEPSPRVLSILTNVVLVSYKKD